MFVFKCIDGEGILSEKDYSMWKWVFSDLDLDAELNRISFACIRKPWMTKKGWFFELSKILHKIEKGETTMAYENNGKGVLFKNNRKEKDTHPDYQGNIEFKGGVPYKLSAWLKKDKNGNTYMSLSVGDVADSRPAPLPKHEETKPAQTDGFDDVPW